MEIFHTMFGHILWCADEIEFVLFCVTPWNELAIDFATDFETVNNINLGCLGGSTA